MVVWTGTSHINDDLVGGDWNMAFIFHFIYGMSSFPRFGPGLPPAFILSYSPGRHNLSGTTKFVSAGLRRHWPFQLPISLPFNRLTWCKRHFYLWFSDSGSALSLDFHLLLASAVGLHRNIVPTWNLDISIDKVYYVLFLGILHCNWLHLWIFLVSAGEPITWYNFWLHYTTGVSSLSLTGSTCTIATQVNVLSFASYCPHDHFFHPCIRFC